MKAAMGFDLPILASYAKAVGGAICPRAFSLGKIIYRASTVYSVLAVLSAKSVASLVLSALTVSK